MLLQEKIKLNGYAAAFWIKATCVLVTLPFVLAYDISSDPWFYIYLAMTAVIYAICDVVFFTAVSKSGAAVVARLVPAASVISFMIWFLVDPALLDKYTAKPAIFAMIFFTLCLFAFFSFRLKKCSVTMNALKTIWFVLFAAVTGPMITKMITHHADMKEAIYSYVFFQGLMMMTLWLAFLLIRRPVALSNFFAPAIAVRGLMIGCMSAGMVLLKFTSFYFVDNPAYIPAMIALDSVIILGVYKALGWKAEGDVRSGLAVVACVVALIILKAQV